VELVGHLEELLVLRHPVHLVAGVGAR
jgi:hypothetical protein